MRVFLALFLVWTLAATLCGGRKSWPLACSGPVAVLMCWVIWYQAQGWPVTSDPAIDLGFFTLVTSLGFVAGKLVRKVIFMLPVLPATRKQRHEGVMLRFETETIPITIDQKV